MLTTKSGENKNIDLSHNFNTKANHVFVFLEIFEREGGIQSYVKDIFRGYLGLGEPLSAEVFLLRDGF